jgi:hypothetical protein
VYPSVRRNKKIACWFNTHFCWIDTQYGTVSHAACGINAQSLFLFTRIRVEYEFACKITLCVWKSYSTCGNQSCACWNHTLACWNHIRGCRNHTACRNYTLRVGIALQLVEIILVSVIFTRICVKVILVCVESTLCM